MKYETIEDIESIRKLEDEEITEEIIIFDIVMEYLESTLTKEEFKEVKENLMIENEPILSELQEIIENMGYIFYFYSIQEYTDFIDEKKQIPKNLIDYIDYPKIILDDLLNDPNLTFFKVGCTAFILELVI